MKPGRGEQPLCSKIHPLLLFTRGHWTLTWQLKHLRMFTALHSAILKRYERTHHSKARVYYNNVERKSDARCAERSAHEQENAHHKREYEVGFCLRFQQGGLKCKQM